jgi:hypothetical protein
VSTPATKSIVIGAAIARFYDTPVTTSETSTSLPHPTPSAHRRHEKGMEKQRELSRTNSSGGTDRVSLSRIRALPEKLVPESGDEAERTRSNRRQLLNTILTDASTQSTPAQTPPPPPPQLPRAVAISRASVAAEEIERERRCRQSSENRAPETSNTIAPTHPHQPQPQPQPQPQIYAQRLAHPRPSIQSSRDAINLHGGEDGMQRRPAYPERHSAAERRSSIGKPQWQCG